MNGKHFLCLGLVYIWGFSLVLFWVFYPHELSVTSRFIILMTAYIPIVIAHTKIAIDTVAWKTKKIFFVLSILWIIRAISFGLDDGLYLLIGQRISILSWLVDISLLVILSLISFSFLLRRPFFYARTESKILIVVGIVGLLLSLWIIIMAIFVNYGEKLEVTSRDICDKESEKGMVLFIDTNTTPMEIG